MLGGEISLEALLECATNPQNSGPDMLAIEGFAFQANDDPDGARHAVRLLATKIQSMHEWEAMQALHVLEYCMKTSGDSGFVSEVAKFRFLNEMIKLVSPKYLGSRTPPAVKTRVLELLYTWTRQFPMETKIQEAYDMLRKQGVVTTDLVPSPCAIVPPRQSDKTSVFEDEEKSRLLRRLLQSKHPDDLQAANRLIKTMVREDEKRSEKHSKLMSVLEQVQNNSQLLAEMLAHYDNSGASSADVELMAELKQACEQLRPGLSRLADECEEQDNILTDIIQAGEELSKVLENYDTVIVRRERLPRTLESASGGQTSLLDLSSPSEDHSPSQINVLAKELNDLSVSSSSKHLSEVEDLKDVFNSHTGSIVTPLVAPLEPSLQSHLLPSPLTPSSTLLLDATGSQPNNNLKNLTSHSELFSSSRFGSASTSTTPVVKSPNKGKDSLNILDLDFIVQSKMTEGMQKKDDPLISDNASLSNNQNSGDDSMLDVDVLSSADSSLINAEDTTCLPSPPQKVPLPAEEEIKPPNMEEVTMDCKTLLTDLFVTLDSIKAGSQPPIVVLDQTQGLSVTLHVAQNSPRPGVFVVVISAQNRCTQPVSSFIFQAIIPGKSCKLRLQPPSSSDLPAFSPFLPPPAITQLLLIANPEHKPVSLKFMVSYSVDGDTSTEMGEVEQLPLPFPI